jgi:transcription-repair coupling factor (superfamily II helicase)
MKIDEILDTYATHEAYQQITEELIPKKGSRIKIKSSGASHYAVLAALSYLKSEKTQLIILNDKEEAAYFLNDLEQILGEDRVLFFPTGYKKVYHVEETHNANVLLRAETLSKLNKNKHVVIVCYAEALSEKVVTRKHLQANTFELKKGEKVSIDFLVEFLNENDFERVDFVTQPGEYAVRGGILDVFSFAGDHPFRIEFFGDETDSIRTFDVNSQLSVAQYSFITIVPNVQNKLVLEQRTTFLEYLDSETIVWLKDLSIVCDKLDRVFFQAESVFEKQETTIKQLPPNELYISGEVFKKHLLAFAIVEFGIENNFDERVEISFDIKPQPVFNKNFELLAESLNLNTKNGIKNYILAENQKQISRLEAIFEDLKTNTIFEPVYGTFHEGFTDYAIKCAFYCDHQIFDRYHKYKIKSSQVNAGNALSLKELYSLQPGDFVTHIDHGVGRFSGLEKIEVNGKLQEAIRLVYKNDDILYVSIHSLHKISKYVGKEGTAPSINKLGSPAWDNLKNKAKKKVKELAFDLIKLYAKRKASKGFAFSPDNYLQNELEASFIYEDTPDQEKATNDVKRDMTSKYPMDRLVCGDVGFGKTEVAIRAAFKAVCDSKQVAVLVPTTILALQHFKTFSERLKNFPCTVDYINRFKSAKAQKETLQKLKEGKVDILVGTHRLVGKDVQFKDLGLLIIDEEQKFGVGVKEKLKTIKENVDTLTLTATPIPRTLQFSLMGSRDLSVISTPPPNRQPVQTEIHTFNEEVIRDAISYEISRGGQVFFIHNQVKSLPEMANIIERLVPEAKVVFAHGQMTGDEMEDRMMQFIDGDCDVLVSTTIVESGLDISNANTIIINNAQNHGLSDLHQMRGRVGRSNKKAFCYLLTPPFSTLSSDARRRLSAIEQFSDIGSGFHIAMRDLDIRGAGDLLGAEQSGFIAEIGYEMYQKILDEAMRELREERYNEIMEMSNGETSDNMQNTSKFFVSECTIETDLEILIPTFYVTNSTERLNLYKALDDFKEEQELIEFRKNLIDRFGKIPKQVDELINLVKLRWDGRDLGIEKLVLKGNKMIGYFVSKADSPFYQSDVFTKILKYIQINSQKAKLKEMNQKLSLSFSNVNSISEGLYILDEIKKSSFN